MYERFTDRARKIMQLANQGAQRLSHESIGTEHILLALVEEGSGVAANVLKDLDVDLFRIRLEVEELMLEVEELMPPGRDDFRLGELPLSPQAKKVIQHATEESVGLRHNYVGSEHILLGLLRDEEGIAARALKNLSVTLELVREGVRWFLGEPMTGRQDAVALQSRAGSTEDLSEKVEEPPAACPTCGNSRIVRILWNRVELEASEAKEVVAGSTILAYGFTGNVPSWGCLTCEPRWSDVHRLAFQEYQWQVAKGEAVALGEFETAAQIRDAQKEFRSQLATLLTQVLLR